MCKPTNGVYAASLTPLTSKLEPNISKLIDHVSWLIESGADGVALLGSTGEANSLTIEQRLNIIKKSGISLPQEKIIIGTGCCALQDTIKLTKASIDSGFFSVLVLPPFYYKPQSDESIFRYFSKLISTVNEQKLRIIFYNFPMLSGYNFNTKILKSLKKEFGKIVSGIKDSSSEWLNIIKLVESVPDFKVYAGTETFLLDTLNIGGSGCISASANLTVKECQKVYQAWKSEKPKIAKDAQNKLSILRKILENYPFISELKSIFANKSDSENWVNMLPPFNPLSSKEIRSIENHLKDVGFDLEQFFKKN